MKNVSKILIKIILLISIIVLIPITYSKYTESKTKHITLNIRKPLYSIMFHSNDESESTSTQDFVYGTSQNLNLNTFSKEHNDFIGWNTLADGSGESYQDEEMVNNLTEVDGKVVDLYAMWMVNEYLVTYSGISDTSSLPLYAAANQSFTVQVDTSLYMVNSITVAGRELETNEYTFENNELSIITPVAGEIVISLITAQNYTYYIDDSMISGSTISFDYPNMSSTNQMDITNFITNSDDGINVSTKKITKIDVVFTYTTGSKGAQQSIRTYLAANGTTQNQTTTFAGKQTNATVRTTFNGLNILQGQSFTISYAKNKLNGTVTLSKVTVEITLSDN